MPLKYLSNFWGTLDTPLINCKIELLLTWSKICLLMNEAERNVATELINQNITTCENVVINTNLVSKVDNPENVALQITDRKLYVLVVTSSTENDNNFVNKFVNN